MAVAMDEIATLARGYFEQHSDHAVALIEDNISRAIGARGWDDVLKWQRVKIRVQRLQSLHSVH